MKNYFLKMIAIVLFIIPAISACSERKMNANSHANTPMEESTAEYPGSGAFTKKKSGNVRCKNDPN